MLYTISSYDVNYKIITKLHFVVIQLKDELQFASLNTYSCEMPFRVSKYFMLTYSLFFIHFIEIYYFFCKSRRR